MFKVTFYANSFEMFCQWHRWKKNMKLYQKLMHFKFIQFGKDVYHKLPFWNQRLQLQGKATKRGKFSCLKQQIWHIYNYKHI